MTIWFLTNSDFPTNQTFLQFHDINTELDLHRLWVVWKPWSICNGCGIPAGNAYPSDCGTCLCSNCRYQIPRTCHVFTRLFTSNTPWNFYDFAYIYSRRFLAQQSSLKIKRTVCGCKFNILPLKLLSFADFKLKHSLLLKLMHPDDREAPMLEKKYYAHAKKFDKVYCIYVYCMLTHQLDDKCLKWEFKKIILTIYTFIVVYHFKQSVNGSDE